MVTQMQWLETHLGSLDKTKELANELVWNLMVTGSDKDGWMILSGDSVILTTDTREVVDAFLYGMGLAFAGIPEDLFETLANDFKSQYL